MSNRFAESLAKAKARYEGVSANAEHQVTFVTSIKEIAEAVIDLVIIATNSAVRYDVYKDVVSVFRVKNVIFEKILFQENRWRRVVCKIKS